MEIRELSDKLKNSGVAGAGGAGFPSYAKLSDRADTVLLNCAECEPLLSLHRQLLGAHPEEILGALSLVVRTLGAKEGIVAVKAEYTETLRAVRQHIDDFPELRIHELPGAYPMGDEVVLIYECTGRQLRPGGLPIEQGVIVYNVETMFNAWHSITGGAAVTDKLVSVVGEVKEPVTLRAPLGTPMSALVENAGGYTTAHPVLLVGGPMMGRFGQPEDPVTRTTNALLVLPEDHPLVLRKKAPVSVDLKRAASICCQCRMCTDLCPRYLLGHPIEPHLFMRSAANHDLQNTDVYLNTFFCCSCGLCELYSCPQGLAPRTLITEYRNRLRARGVKAPQNVRPAPVRAAREYRRAPETRLAARLDLVRYDVPAPLVEERLQVPEVKLLLSQHIGAPARTCVKAGEHVRRGQAVAQAGEGLSIPVHASIDGTVTEVTDRYVVVRRG